MRRRHSHCGWQRVNWIVLSRALFRSDVDRLKWRSRLRQQTRLAVDLPNAVARTSNYVSRSAERRSSSLVPSEFQNNHKTSKRCLVEPRLPLYCAVVVTPHAHAGDTATCLFGRTMQLRAASCLSRSCSPFTQPAGRNCPDGDNKGGSKMLDYFSLCTKSPSAFQALRARADTVEVNTDLVWVSGSACIFASTYRYHNSLAGIHNKDSELLHVGESSEDGSRCFATTGAEILRPPSLHHRSRHVFCERRVQLRGSSMAYTESQ